MGRESYSEDLLRRSKRMRSLRTACTRSERKGIRGYTCLSVSARRTRCAGRLVHAQKKPLKKSRTWKLVNNLSRPFFFLFASVISTPGLFRNERYRKFQRSVIPHVTFWAFQMRCVSVSAQILKRQCERTGAAIFGLNRFYNVSLFYI